MHFTLMRLGQMGTKLLWRTGIWSVQMWMCTVTSQRNFLVTKIAPHVAAPSLERPGSASSTHCRAVPIAMCAGKNLGCLVDQTFNVHSTNFHPVGFNLESKMITLPHGLFLQVQIGEEVPAIVSPTKPKFHVFGTVAVAAGCAVKLKWWGSWFWGLSQQKTEESFDT